MECGRHPPGLRENLGEAESPLADDLFRPRVEPDRGPAPTEEWPAGWDDPADGAGGLLAAFDVHRRELDERLKARVDDEVPPEQARPAAVRKPPTPVTLAAPAPPPALPALPTRPAFSIETAGTSPARQRPTADGAVAPPPTSADRTAGAAGSEHRRRKPWLVVGLLVAATAGTGIATAVASGSGGAPAPHTGTSAPSAPGPEPSPVSGAAAADWIMANVGFEHVVACDVTICGLLRERGFPETSLVVVHSGLTEVERADLVVVGDVLRGQFGSGLAAITAAEPLAVFTAGSSTVTITPVTLDGPRAYSARLTADRAARRQAGAALLRNPRITADAAARTSLTEGLVDTRVCALLAVLGGSHHITIGSFTGLSPGAGPDRPFTGVVLSTVDTVPAGGGAPRAAALRAIVRAQQPPYSPLSVTPVAVGADRGLAVLFSQPEPLGLLNAPTS